MRKGDVIDFRIVHEQASKMAFIISENKTELLKVLTKYETFKTAEDEIARSLDLLLNLHENQEYFNTRVGRVAAFMPSNQPLYSFTCFAIVPALMSEKVFVKAPEVMSSFYEEMLNVLKIETQPFKIEYMKYPRNQCVEIFSSKTLDPKTNIEKPDFEVVIFTGTSKNADLLRKKFDSSVLFITNGSGHNPIIITPTANIDRAVDSIISVCTYNQGQDCASPNSILVHTKVYNQILQKLREKVMTLCIGQYISPETNIGPISRPETIKFIQEFLSHNRNYIDESTPGVIKIKESIVEPTILTKPIYGGGNFEEVFAPVFVIQRYDEDEDLKLYFEDDSYANNAMYITIFGYSKYIENFVSTHPIGSTLHDMSSIFYNTDLHKPGIERGVYQYGGRGRGASCISKDGVIFSTPTLPQREIYEYLVKGNSLEKAKANPKNISIQQAAISYKDKISMKVNIDDLLKLYPPDMLKWLLSRLTLSKLLNTAIGNIVSYYDEFDTIINSINDGSICNTDQFLVNLLNINDKDKREDLSFKKLLNLAQSVHWKKQKLLELIRVRKLPYKTKSINLLFPRVKYWAKLYNKDLIFLLKSERNEDYLKSLSSIDMALIKKLHTYLLDNINRNLPLEELEATLYDLPKVEGLTVTKLKESQKFFFRNVYNLLTGSDNGPRLATFIWAGNQRRIIKLLNTKGFD